MKQNIVFLIVIMMGLILSACTQNSSNKFLEYNRSGGFSGFDDQLVIDSSGKATLTRKDNKFEFVVSSDELSTIKSDLETIKFTQLDKEYLPKNQGADLFDYRLTFEGHSIHTMDTAVPEDLWLILEKLNQLIETNS